MTFTSIQKREAYKKLSPEVQNFIMEGETTDLIERYLLECGLTTEQSNNADTEILNTMFGLQTLSDALSNIAKLSNKNVNDLAKLKINLEKNIFSKISVEENKIPPQLKDRVGEITKKYSLDEKQSIALNNLISMVIKEGKKPETFLQTVIADVGISNLLAEQIMADLEKRVFEYALGQIDQPNQTKTEKAPEMTQPINKIPEIRPVTMPMVESNQPVKVVPPPPRVEAQPAPKPATPAYVPQAPRNEPVQQPVSVPRFTSTPITNTPPVSNTSPQPNPVNPTPRPIQSPPTPITSPTPQPAPKPPEKYTVDPYREPIN